MPTVGVSTTTFSNNQILMVMREDFPIWTLPGGTLEPNESFGQTAIRETFEETGIEIKIIDLVGVYSRPHWREGGSHEILFSATPVKGSMIPQPGETVDVRYFDLENLPEATFWWDRQRIQDANSGQKGIARIQNAVWPLEDMRLREIHKLRDRGKLPLEELYKQFCEWPKSEENKMEF
ncbi:MAG: NUDIX domain-containing protein [Anaerolineales bacterium]|nr:NUDIX domain-containing protein [Anaerolineales bacterium]